MLRHPMKLTGIIQYIFVCFWLMTRSDLTRIFKIQQQQKIIFSNFKVYVTKIAMATSECMHVCENKCQPLKLKRFLVTQCVNIIL